MVFKSRLLPAFWMCNMVFVWERSGDKFELQLKQIAHCCQKLIRITATESEIDFLAKKKKKKKKKLDN